MAEDTITIVLADDHSVVRSGLKMLLEAQDDLDVVAEAGDVDATRRSVLGYKPTVLVLDLNMPGGSSLESIPAMIESSPDTAIVVLTMLGRALRPLAEAAGHELAMPRHEELDLFDASAVAAAVRHVDGVLHLATRIRTLDQISDPDAWRENDRLRADASRIIVDAAIAAGVAVYVQPTVTFVYAPDGPTSEDTPIGEVLPILRSALAGEQQAERFARAGGRGVVLRLGLLDGPGTWYHQPMGDFGATLHVSDAGRALVSALSLPSGIYNVCRNGERVSVERFTRAAGWHPQR